MSNAHLNASLVDQKTGGRAPSKRVLVNTIFFVYGGTKQSPVF